MINARLRALVARRAEHRCEYCRLPQALPIQPTFHVEHIIPKKHGGTDQADHLALAYHHCNLAKGANLTGIDRTTGRLTPLFHPRIATWHQHFIVHQVTVSGRTAVGRTTVRVLNFNTLDRLRLRVKLRSLDFPWP